MVGGLSFDPLAYPGAVRCSTSMPPDLGRCPRLWLCRPFGAGCSREFRLGRRYTQASMTQAGSPISLPSTGMLTHVSTGSTVAKVRLVDGFWAQGVGVLGMSRLPARTGIVMPGVASIHTLFVRFPLDILFLDPSFVLLKAVAGVAPWRPLVRCAGAYYTVELGAGTIDGGELFQVGGHWRVDR